MTVLDQSAQPLPTMERILKSCLGKGYKLPAVYQHHEITSLAKCVLAKDEDGIKVHSKLMLALHDAMWNQYLFLTESGYFATGSHTAEGDLICILHGCTHPVAMHTIPLKSGFRVTGTCSLEGRMDPRNNKEIDSDIHDAEESCMY